MEIYYTAFQKSLKVFEVYKMKTDGALWASPVISKLGAFLAAIYLRSAVNHRHFCLLTLVDLSVFASQSRSKLKLVAGHPEIKKTFQHASRVVGLAGCCKNLGHQVRPAQFLGSVAECSNRT